MSESQHHQVIILGSGPAGYTAAIYAARANLNPALVQGMEPGGQLMTTTDVDNWPGEPEGIQGPELMDKMKRQAERFDTAMVFDHIGSSDLSQRPFTLYGERATYTCDALIISTGASARYLGLPSEEEFKGKGVSACATCDGFFYKNQKVMVVGGGDSAVEEALFLSNIADQVTVVHRRDEFRAEKIMQQKLFDKDNIDVIWNHQLDEVLGDATGVTGARIKDTQSGETQDLELQGVFVAIGHKPNTDMFGDELEKDEAGYLLTQPDSTVDGFELNSHTEGSIASEDGSATTASHGAITFDGTFGGQMTINGTIYDTVSFIDASTGCTYSLATVSTWINLLIDPTAMETDGGPSSGSLSLAASISTSCGAGASDSLEVSGDWTMNMTFSNGTSTITVSDGEQEWTYVQDDSDSGGGDSTGDSTWHDSTGDSTWPGDTTSDSTGDTTGPIDTTGDTTYYSYCDSLPQVELDSMKLWAYEDNAAYDDDASVPEVLQITIEALQTIDTGLATAFPFAAPLLDPSQATVAWDSSLQAYIIDYDMQMTFVDTTYYNDTMEIHNEDINVVGSDTATVWSGDSIVSLPSAAIDSISIRNEFYGMFVHNGVDTSQE